MATFTVTSAFDTVDPSDGETTLREAVALANATAGADTVTFDPAVFTGGAASLIRLTQGQIEITETLVVDGSTGTEVTITGDAGANDALVDGTFLTDVAASLAGADLLADNSRIFEATAGDLTLESLTLTGGRTTAASADGGAVDSSDALTLIDATIAGNSTAGDFADGGGVAGNDDVTLTNSTVSGNSTTGDDSDGGGVYGFGAVLLTDSVVSNNSAAGENSRGGGVFGRLDVTLTNTAVSGNSTGEEGGPGGGVFGVNTVTLTNSTISGNSTADAFADGGGVTTGFGDYTGVTLTNSTISGNSTAGANASGGGLFALVGDITLTNSTVSGNSTAGDDAFGGGVFISDTASLTLTDSVLLGNVTTYTGVGDDEVGVDGSLALAGSNVIGDGAGGANVYAGATDVGDSTADDVFAQTVDNNGVDAGALADNGGPVATIALAASPANPALDASTGGTVDADARGVAAVDIPGVGAAGSGAAVRDLGAFELDAAVETPSLEVTTTLDVVDPFDGETSLREAVALANATAGADTVTFDPAVFTGGDASLIRLTQGQIEITETLVVDGSTGTEVTITGDAGANDALVDGTFLTDVAASLAGADLLADNSRIFEATAGDLTLESLTLTGGRTTAASADGGAVRTFGAVVLSDATVAGNSTAGESASGGAIFGSYVTATNSTISGNSTTGDVANGGGIASAFATLIDSTVSNNGTAGYRAEGGGVYGYEVTLTNTTVVDNRTSGDEARGGGVYGEGPVTLTTSMVSNNSTTGEDAGGGGVFGDGLVTLTDSAVTGNSTAGDYAGGGGVFGRLDVMLTNSTVSGNSTAGIEADGGGIAANGAVTLLNSTVAGNSTSGDNAGGGGVAGLDVALTNTTVSGNSTAGGGANGGGLLASNGLQPLALTDSVVLGNVTTAAGVDGDEVSGTLALAGGNIVGDGAGGANVYAGAADVGDTTAAEVFAQTVDNNGVDAGALADNGGPVATIALAASPANPALDASTGGTVDTDARGVAAVDIPDVGADGSGAAVRDLGAFELDAVVETPSLEVTTALDVVDPLDGETSLREAIGFLNDGLDVGGASTITFADAAGEAFETGGTIFLQQGALEIAASLTIAGLLDDAGEPLVEVSADSAEGADDATSRVFTIDSASDDAEIFLDGLVIRDGSAEAPGGGVLVAEGDSLTLSNALVRDNASLGGTELGGGIYAEAATLAVQNSTVTGNTGRLGGGISGDGSAVTVTDSSVSGNDAEGDGGGIYSSLGSLVVTNGTLSDNSADFGGGIYIYGGDLTVTNSAITGNTARVYGGGIQTVESTLDLDGSDVVDNAAANSGGGLYGENSELTITSSMIQRNAASFDGGGLFAGGGAIEATDSTIEDNEANFGGGIALDNAELAVTRSTLSGNGAALDGGALFSIASNVTFADSAISDNTAAREGGGVWSFEYVGGTSLTQISNTTISGNSATTGGGIYSYGALRLESSTISGNSAGYGGGIQSETEPPGPGAAVGVISNSTVSGNEASEFGGGIRNYAGSLEVRNSTVSDNTAPIGAGIASAGDDDTRTELVSSIVADNGGGGSDLELVDGIVNSFASGGANLVGNDVDNTFREPADIVGADPGLGALTDNGGPTATQAPLDGSPAIDAGANPDGLAFDQRGDGFLREVDQTDIGAVELQEVIAPSPLVISEIMYNPVSAEDDNEWVEVFNTGTADIDLAGWVIDDADAAFLQSSNIAAGVVPAGGSAILYNADDLSAADFATRWGAGINLVAVSDWGALSLDNSGDTVSLWDSFAAYDGGDGTPVVSVAYDDSAPWPVDDGAASIYLTDLAADAADGANWALSADGVATPVNVARTSILNDVGSPGGVAPLELVLIDADSDSEAGDLVNGRVLDVATLGLTSFSAEAVTPEAEASIESVRFVLNGPVSTTRVENLEPYALFGDRDRGTDFVGEPLVVGEYTLSATPYSGNGASGTIGAPVTVNFTVIDSGEPSGLSVALVDAASDERVRTLTDGAVLDLADPELGLGFQFSLEAITPEAEGAVQSVVFDLDGPVSQTQTENLLPYALFGDRAGGTNLFGRTLEVGSYELTVTPYPQNAAGGPPGTPFEIAFEVVDTGAPALQLFLVDAESDERVDTDPLSETERNLFTVDDFGLEQLYAIEAEAAEDAGIESVVFAIQRPGESGFTAARTENFEPYASFGDTDGGDDFFGEALALGDYVVRATAYSGNFATGAVIGEVTAGFSVEDVLI